MSFLHSLMSNNVTPTCTKKHVLTSIVEMPIYQSFVNVNPLISV